ncbi:MAG: Na+/H+ antiporter subunit E [Hellea sp.]
MRHASLLTLAMAATWLMLSGYFIGMILTFGFISIILVVWMTKRLSILDNESVPYLNILKTCKYYIWLFIEIVKANIQVVKAVIGPNAEISPSLIKIPMHTDIDIAQTMFANSITLTPGTVSVDVQKDHILVHALLKEMSKPEDFYEMHCRSAKAVSIDLKDN